MDCPHQIPPSGTPACHHRQDSNTRHHTRYLLLDTVTRTGIETADQGCSPIPTDIIITVVMTPTEAIAGHITETVDTIIGALCDAITPVLTITAMTHHTKDHPHIGVLQFIQKMAADPDHVLHIKQVRKLCVSLHPILADLQ